MTPRVDTLELAGLQLASGEGRQIELSITLDPFELGSDTYQVLPEVIETRLDVSRTIGSGYALRLRFTAQLVGPCMRCLQPADPTFEVDAREVSQPGEIDELDSPYVDAKSTLDLAGWARDALALALPAAILCRPDCAGLCVICGVDLNTAGPEHHHEREPDSRWAKLSELKFDTEDAET